MAIENKDFNENIVPIGITDTYFGATENESPVMIDPIENGIIKDDAGNELVVFASASQALASFMLSKFSVPQIKRLIPNLRNVSSAILNKIVFDNSSRVDRKDFIESLRGNMPRQLTVMEYVNVVKAVGEPASKAQLDNLEKVLTKIKLDMDNVDLIIQVKNPKSAKVITFADVSEKIARTERSIVRSESQIKVLGKKLTLARETLANNTEDRLANYNAKMAELNLTDAENRMKQSMIKLENLKNVLATFDTPEENQ